VKLLSETEFLMLVKWSLNESALSLGLVNDLPSIAKWLGELRGIGRIKIMNYFPEIFWILKISINGISIECTLYVSN
jgi:hypothetical protein